MLKRPRSLSPKVSSKSLHRPLPKRVRLEGELVSTHSETFTIDHPTVATLDQNTDISPDIQMWEALPTPMDPDSELSGMDEEVDQLDEESEDGMEEQSLNKYSGKTESQNNLEIGDIHDRQLLPSPPVDLPSFLQATSASLPRTPLSRSVSGKHNFTPIKPKRTRHKFNFRPLATSPTPTPVINGVANYSNTIVLASSLDPTKSITTEFAGASPLSSSNPFLDMRIEQKDLSAIENMTHIHKPSTTRRNRRNIWNESGTDGDAEYQESESDADDSEDDNRDGNGSDGSNDGGSWVTAARKEERPASCSWNKKQTINPLRYGLTFC